MTSVHHVLAALVAGVAHRQPLRPHGLHEIDLYKRQLTGGIGVGHEGDVINLERRVPRRVFASRARLKWALPQ